MVNHSAKCKVWWASRNVDHNLGGVIARSYKGREIADAQNTSQGREVKVHQFHVESEIQTLRTDSGVDFESDSGSLGLYLQHIFKNQPWESGETARNYIT